MPDLKTLEFPRHLHKPAGAFLHVDNHEQAAAALADGWSLDCVPDAEPDAADAPAEAVTTETPKRGRPRKAAAEAVTT